MRKTIQACKSRNFHFPNDIAKDRVISYLKIGDNESLQVYLNCENEEVEIPLPETYEVIFSRKWSQEDDTKGTLAQNGVLIIKLP